MVTDMRCYGYQFVLQWVGYAPVSLPHKLSNLFLFTGDAVYLKSSHLCIYRYLVEYQTCWRFKVM